MIVPHETNNNHPDARDGEVFLGNTEHETREALLADNYFYFKFKTLHLGSTAYHRNNTVIEGSLPIFVEKQELIDLGVRIPIWE